PLELVSDKYASSRFLQQRYDPGAAPHGHAAGERPRVSVSIPSLRGGAGCRAAAESCSLAGRKASISGARPSNSRHLLRHQSTLPDFHSLDAAVLGDQDWLRTPLSVGPGSRRALASRATTYVDVAALPILPPPPAHLAGASDHPDYSPVNTLVHDQSPVTAAATVGRSEGGRRTVRKPSRMLDVSGDYDVDRTLSYAQDTGAPIYNGAAPRDQHVYQSGTSYSKSGGGWQLKTKFLHPLSTWFRSSRHQSTGGHGAAAGPVLPVAAGADSLVRSTRNPLSGACPPPPPACNVRSGSA
ncbi:hypothetical protein IWQ57_005510, partial [Coemansia nantahalensis]